MATTVPTANRDHPNRVNSLTVACTHDRSKISAPILPIISKKSEMAPVNDLIQPLEDGVEYRVGNGFTDIIKSATDSVTDAGY